MPEDTTYSALKRDLNALDVPNPASSDCGNINFTGTVSADGDQGLTGERTVGGYKITFKKGLLVGFEAV